MPAFSVSPSRFSELVRSGDRCCSQESGASLSPHTWILSDCPWRSLQTPECPLTAAFRRTFTGVPCCGALLNLFFNKLFNLDPTRSGELYSPPSRAPITGKAIISTGRLPGIIEGAVSDRLTHCHSFDRHGTHTVGLGIVFQGSLLYIRRVLRNRATSRMMWLFTTHGRSSEERGCNRIYLPWGITRALLGLPMSPTGSTPTPVRPGRLPLAPLKDVSSAINKKKTLHR